MRLGDRMSLPEVLICIPTYNRSKSLIRAVESASRQSYPKIRIIVLDNASTDDTKTVVEKYCRSKSNIEYYRNDKNIGAARNFNKIMSIGVSKYSMWLADDDWISEGYVSDCMGRLLENEELVLVSGKSVFEGKGASTISEKMFIRSKYRWFRVVKYYFLVNDNSVFYGVYKNKGLVKPNIRDKIGSDWYFIAAICYQGAVETVESSSLYRSIGGASADLRHIAKVWGEPFWVKWEPYFGASVGAFKDLLVNKEVYGGSAPIVRMCVGGVVFTILFCKKVVARRIYRLVKRIAEFWNKGVNSG